MGDGVTQSPGSGDRRWLVPSLIAAAATLIALAFSDVVELLVVVGFVLVVVVVVRGLRSQAARWGRVFVMGSSRQMRAGARLSTAAFLVAAIAASCAGSSEPALTLSDAPQLVHLRPVAPGWAWPPESKKSADSGASTDDPLLADFQRKTEGLADLGQPGNEWQDEDKLAHVDVAVYETAADAHKAFAPFNALSLGWARRSGHVVSQNEVDGLGEEAWLLRLAESGEQVTYHPLRGEH
jgi:hypothetical protein